MYECRIINNNIIKCGYYKSFYDNGNKHIEADYYNNELDGTYKVYGDNGNLCSDIYYMRGTPVDTILYNEKGQKYKRIHRVNNTDTNTLYMYYDSGVLRSQCDYSDDVKHGLHIYFSEDGCIDNITHYLYDEKVAYFDYI